jgi:hypothetical protein
VDCGLIKKCLKEELYEISNELLEHPFTAVRCKLDGVMPKKKDWDHRSLASLKHLVKTFSSDEKYAMTVKNQIYQGYFEVSLTSKDTQKDFAKAAIKANYAVLKFNPKDTEKALASNLEKLLEDGDALVGSTSGLFKMIGLPETTKILPPDDPPKESAEDQSKDDKFLQKIQKRKSKNLTKIQQSLNEKSNIQEFEIQPCSFHQLRPIFQHPYIDWYQHVAMVGLKIDARGALEYSLELTETTISIFMTYPNMKKHAHIELYGSIKPKFSSHSRKYDNEITVRLAKRLSDVDWPRLTSAKEKNNFITYRDGDMPDDNVKHEMRVNYLPADYYDDDSESDGLKIFDDQLENGEII